MTTLLPPGLTLGPASPTRGRSVIATQSFRAGSTICEFTDKPPSTSSQPVPATLCIAIPDSPNLSQTCSHCLSPATSALPEPSLSGGPAVQVRACSGCRTVHYCSPACQKADWKLVHGKGECKAFQSARASLEALSSSAKPVVLPTPVRALIQVLLRPDMLAAVDELEGHVDSVRTAAGTSQADMQLQVRGALHYLGRELSRENVDKAIEITCKLQVNSFNRLDADIGQSGMFVSPGLAMINHSCIPNAVVQFAGRRAVLHANRDIKKGEEVELSYIDCTLHRSRRQRSLKSQYYFECACPRCKDDLDVYQVCQKHSHLEMNSYSLVPDLNKLRNPPVKQFLNSSKSLQQNVEYIHPICSAPLQASGLAAKRQQLRQRWNLCEQLRKAGLYAIEPLPYVLVEASVYFTEKHNFSYALIISCFIALNCDSYRGPMPFSGVRVRGMLILAKLLVNTTMTASSLSAGGGALAGKVSQAMRNMDQLTMCQTVSRMVVHYYAMAHSEERLVYGNALDILKEIENLTGRDTQNALVEHFSRNPNYAEEREFFEKLVLIPIQTLAGFALEVMDDEFST